MPENRGRGAGELTYPSAFQANYALAILLIAYILSFVDRQILSLLVGPIRQDLGISDFEFSLLQGMAFALLYTVVGIPIGRLADRSKRKTIIAVGIACWSGMTVMCGLARSFGVLFMARVGVGIGEAALSPPAYSLLSDYFKPSKLTRATSIFTLGVTIGGGGAYILGGPVIEAISNMGALHFPLIGEIAPWQATFIVVGLPGAIVAVLALTILEPSRKGRAVNVTKDEAGLSLSDAFRFLRQRWKAYSSIVFGVTLLSMLGYGTLNWYPTFLIRTFSMSVRDVGLSFGFIYLVFGSLGALSGAYLAQRLYRAGYSDANLRVLFGAALLLVIPGVVGPLMPSATAALLLSAPTVFLLSCYFGISIAALQLITPNELRAFVSALFLLATNIVGLGIGATLVAVFTDFVFHDDALIKYSLATVAAIFCPLAAIVFRLGFRPYRESLREAATWS